MKNTKLDTELEDLETIMRPYEAALVYRFIDETENSPDFVTGSGDSWRWLCTQEPELHRSRSAVLGSLNKRVEEGILRLEEEEPGKGGYHKMYALNVDRDGLEDLVVDRVLNCLDLNFGDGLRRAIKGEIDREVIRRALS